MNTSMVLLEGGKLHESLIAEVAVVRSFPCMCAHMLLQSFLARESLVAIDFFAAKLAAHNLLRIVFRVPNSVVRRVLSFLHFNYTI